MKLKILLAGLTFLAAAGALAQVDVEHRRTVTVQTGFAVADSEESPGGFGAWWFNENHFPWPDTALRIFFAGVYLDSELSWFLNENSAIGAGLGGGLYLDSLSAYDQGERLSNQEFYGDGANARVFVNQTIPNPTPLPLNVRGTYGVSGSFFRKTESTRDFVLPDSFLTHTLTAELRFGGIEPGMTSRRGAELYLALDANYRSGFEAFGPKGALFPAHNKYQRAFGSLAGKIPWGATTIAARIGGGLGEHLDELSAWKLGGNLIGVDQLAFPLHGYYTRELLADDFGIVNLELSQLLSDAHRLTAHLYGDYATARLFEVRTGRAKDWHGFIGVGAGLGFRAIWEIDMLVTYGYGINARRNGHPGGHEVGLAFEKQF